MANCTDCNSSNISLTGTWFPGSPCASTDCGGNEISAACVIYNGPNLECSSVETLDNLEIALQKIDEQICAIIGDYSTYNMHCLPDWWEAAITTQEDFVDAITDYVCTLNDLVDTFINTTYAANQIILDDRLVALEVPGITCASASVVDTDTLNQILTKYCTKFASLTTAISIASVTWNSCLTVVSTPTTIADGFQLLADQICILYGLVNEGGILPTFDNYSSCIGGTSDDTLVETIELIKTRLCLTPTFDNDNLSSTCFDVPTDSTDLETLIQTMLDGLDSLQQNYVIFDGSDFVVTATDAGDPCAGITVSLATPINQDRFVASNASDTSPGTLVSKLTSGGSISFDDSSNTDVSLDITDADYGDITVTSTGSVWTIDNDVVTFAKMQNVNTGILLGRSTASTGNVEEIAIGSGLQLSGGVLSNIAGRTLLGITVFDASGTWTKPTNCTAVVVEILGAGGGGGGANTVANLEAGAGAGGASGSYLKLFIEASLGATETVVVGSGGAGVSTGVGNTGGDSSFGLHGEAEGGSGGESMVGGTTVAISASGQGNSYTVAVPGTVLIQGTGGQGHYGTRLSGTVAHSGTGAASALSPSSGGGLGGPGAGGMGTYLIGDGAPTAVTGWDGGNGIVIVYEYS